MPSYPQVERIGHRGAPNDRLENTLPSFRRAVELGANAVELDVHVTADGVPVVHHDPELHFDVTPTRFASTSIARLNSRDLQEIRLKSGDPLPTLEKVFEAMAPRTKVYVEIKGGSPAIIAAVVAPYRDWAAVHSFDHNVIAEMRRIAPAIPRGILIEKSAKDLAGMVERTGASDVWPAFKLVDQRFMEEAHRVGVRVIPWTVNSGSAIHRLVGLGVAGICTNDLGLFQIDEAEQLRRK
jgi:glycerophosphoryl diester phosphodiesterase